MLKHKDRLTLLKDLRQLEDARKKLPEGPGRDLIERDQLSILQAAEGAEDHKQLLEVLLLDSDDDDSEDLTDVK